MNKKKTKQRYRIRNWKDYNTALVRRGSLTVWFDEEAVGGWHQVERRGECGAPLVVLKV